MKEIPSNMMLILIVALILVSIVSTWIFLSSVYIVPKAAPSSTQGTVSVYVMSQPSSSEGEVSVIVLPGG